MTAVGSVLFFTANDGEVWARALEKLGNTAGTVLVKDMVATNTDQRIGQTWAPGVYILRAQAGKSVRSTIIVKK